MRSHPWRGTSGIGHIRKSFEMKSRVERFGIWVGVGERVGAGNTASSESLCVVYEVSGSFLSSSAKVLLPSSRSLKKVSHHFPAHVLSPSGLCPVTSRSLSCPLREVSHHFPAPFLSASRRCPITSQPLSCPLRGVSRHFPAPVLSPSGGCPVTSRPLCV